MTDKNEKDLFIDAINNLPDDVVRAKYEGYMPSKRPQQNVKLDAPYDKTVDLHGLTRKEALIILRNTLSTSKGKRLKILVITGRGNRSDGGIAVIREAVQNFLEKAGSLYIREYRTAPQKHGGDGAFEILTK